MAYSSSLSNGQFNAHDSALSMGPHQDDAAKIKELEEEVQFLAEKTSDSSQRYADYENEIRVLQAQLRQYQRRDAAAADQQQQALEQNTAPQAPAPPPSDMTSGISRFGSLIGVRQPVAVQQQKQQQPQTPTTGGFFSSSPAGPAREKELEEALAKEQTRRIAAEQKVRAVNAEIEELSVTLFQQANEMVAKERRENAGLKEKLEEAEKTNSDGIDTRAMQREIEKLKNRVQLLEQRDLDRKRRLDRLEAANKRIERVKTMLLPR